MAYVIAAPEMMTAAGTDLAAIGSNVDAAHAVAAAPTGAITPAAADEVSTAIAHLFSQQAQAYHAAAAQASSLHRQFASNLTAGAFSYSSIEAAITSLLYGPGLGTNWLVSVFGPGFADTNLLAFLLGTGLFFVLIPADVLFVLALPFLGVLAAA